MAKSLLIVESPSKARTIQKYLGKDFVVKSSVGHVKDLPKDEIGIDVDGSFEPHYITIHGKKKVLDEIRSAARNAARVYLATDPDREGEAIAWHIAQEIQDAGYAKDKLFRVRFNEITKKAILQGLEEPTRIDDDMVNAQQARRVLDRIVGYRLSPLLWDKVKRGLSAGRVQSVAVRLVAEREAEIRAFVPEESWSITARFAGPPPFEARFTRLDGKAVKLTEEGPARALVAELADHPYRVDAVTRKERKKKALAPFITSQLQQDASRRLGFAPKRTMSIAQQLYEGVEMGSEGPVGLITYMRTDSTRISPDAVEAARDFIRSSYGADYLPDKPNVYKSKSSAQDAHEAIRPTDVTLHPDQVAGALSRDQYRLYKLIWERFVACQMTPARYDDTAADLLCGRATFRATGSVLTFPGWRRAYGETVADPEDEKVQPDETAEEQEGVLPALEEGQKLTARELEPKQHFTQPPPRYSEASLIKELEERGIGRPSTYATIITTIQDRKYVEKRESRLHPTDLGVVVNDLLVAHFPKVLDPEFTAGMEAELDEVEHGKKNWQESVRDFYVPFNKDMETAQEEMRNIKREQVPTDIDCDQCGQKMVIRWGRHGRFLACSAYPECKNTQEFRESERGIEIVHDEVTSTPCPQCAKPMAIKNGRFGRFLACTGYPECKTTRPIPTGVKCPREGCGGDLVEKQSRKGKVFFSCGNYPKCDFASWDRPVAEPCPTCEHPFLVVKRGGLVCPVKGCGYTKKAA
ncbi:MAG: type I DNA topoisomerase [Nitrospirota bacterium]|nr:type I DNA topoisomerase [Nitrospirota bacterium]